MPKIRRLIASVLIACLALPLPSYAGMIATDATLPAAQRSRVMSLLERADVRAQLAAHGVSAADVQARVASLSDEEAAKLAQDIDRLPAGGADLLGAIIIVFVILLITDLLGYTKVFPFTRSAR